MTTCLSEDSAALIGQFPDLAGKEEAIAACSSVLRLFSLSVSEFYFKWESFCLSLDEPEMGLEPAHIQTFKESLQRQISLAHKATPASHMHNGGSMKKSSQISPGSISEMLDSVTPKISNFKGPLKRKLRDQNLGIPYETTPKEHSIASDAIKDDIQTESNRYGITVLH